MEETKKVFVSPFEEVKVNGDDNIKYFRDYLKNVEIKNKLLGAFDEYGEYKIVESLKKELSSCEKGIISKNDKEIVAKAEIKEFTLDFVIEIEIVEREKTASLYLIENIKSLNEDFSKKIKIFISSFTDFNDIYYEEKLYKLYHLHDKSGQQKDYDKEKNAPNVYDKLKLQKQLYDILLRDSDEISKLYLQKMILILEKSGKEGEYLLRRYREFLEQNQDKFQKGDKGYYVKLKNVLDEIMFASGLELDEKPSRVMQSLQDTFMMAENSVRKLPPKKEEDKKKKKSVVIQDKKNPDKKDDNKKPDSKIKIPKFSSNVEVPTAKDNTPSKVEKPPKENKPQPLESEEEQKEESADYNFASNELKVEYESLAKENLEEDFENLDSNHLKDFNVDLEMGEELVQ